jgi:hypothetical protein
METLASKIVSVIPEVGPVLSKAMGGVAKAAGAASDAIHVRLSDKLEKGMRVMKGALKGLSAVPSLRRRDLSDEEAFQQRDISDKYYSKEFDMDDISLAPEHLHSDEESDVDDDYEHYEHWE